ncbi:MAG: penicillin-binding protein activator [Rickettsiales bacterium]|jgi:ABC-type branched-subunit amino acid transport system substrate-binding protein|nr:penicillin-binding protein activator [Rickettsiales bacterium]
MFMKKAAFLLLGFAFLNGCVDHGREWGSEWSGTEPAAPTEMMESPASEYGAEPVDKTLKTVSVLLPLSGPNGAVGTGIQHAIEIAFFQKQPGNIMVSFHDISGKTEDRRRVMDMVLSNKPDLIIGPLFADDAEMLKEMKPTELAALTFTSAKRALGDGVFTLALIPNQAVEAIMKQIKVEEKKKLLILAPDTATGYMLANNALQSARIYDVDVAGLYFFIEQDAADMKSLAEEVSLYQARASNLVNAKEILSDVLINQKLIPSEKDSIKTQLEELNKRDSLGEAPFDSVLFLGTAADSKTLGAYLRYYDITAGTTQFYGSALWDTDIAYRDSSLAGGEYAGLPRISDSFMRLYSEIEGVRPTRFDTIAYDAAMLAIKALSGPKPIGAYLLDPSGYNGMDGLVRLRPNGENERALVIMQLNGVSLPTIKKRAESSFTKPIYQTSDYELGKPFRKKLSSDGYDPMNYIRLPEHIASKYHSKTYGATSYADAPYENPEPVEVYPEEEGEVVSDPAFQPTKLDSVDKQLIDEVRMKAN